jgi:hypothetical protein
MAAIGLVAEWIDVTREMPGPRVIRLVLLGVANLIFTACLAAVAACNAA